MADTLVDILGYLQPDSGDNWVNGLGLYGNAAMMWAFEDYYVPMLMNFAFYTENTFSKESNLVRLEDVENSSGYRTFPAIYRDLNSSKNISYKALPDVPDPNNLPSVIIGFSGPMRSKQNILINLNQRPIFQRIYASKWECLKELQRSNLFTYIADIAGEIKTYEDLLLRGNVDGANKKEAAMVADFKLIQADIVSSVKDGSWDKNKIPSCFLPDPSPALPGPPTQNIFGTLNKAPTVDDANIKLPSQTVKSLSATDSAASLDKLSAASSKAADKAMEDSSAAMDKAMASSSDSLTSTPTIPEKLTGSDVSTSNSTGTSTVVTTETVTGGGSTTRISFPSSDPRSRMTYAELDALANGAGKTEFVTPGKNLTTTTTDTVNSSVSSVSNASGTSVVAKLESSTDIKTSIPKTPSVSTPAFVKDGLGDEWSPNKFDPKTIAGNTKIVDPYTGDISSTTDIAAVDKLKGALPDVPKPDIPNLPSGMSPTNMTNADGALTKLSGGNTDSVSSLNPSAAISSPSLLTTVAKAAAGIVAGGAVGAVTGALTGGGSKGALIGGLTGAVGGIAGGALSGGGGIGSVLGSLGIGGGAGAVGGAATKLASGASSLGSAAAKLVSVKKDMPIPKIPRPPNMPRIKKIKLKSPKAS